jgi:CDP-glycerol:poly(glycerophosphate) glycerophosphotransferase
VSFFSNRKNYRAYKKLERHQKNIVFYSESGQDWHHFEPTIKYLTETLGKTLCYISSDSSDPGLRQHNPRILPFCIEEGFFRTLFFQMLEADVMVLTMLDLGNFELKRSINPVYYIYMFHSMSSTHMVDFENSYDHYDAIFCVGPHQMQEIRKREKLHGLPAKNLVEHGYRRLERLIAKNAVYKRDEHANPIVLVAPTWGDDSIVNLCGEELLRILLDAGMHVIFRPHYHTRKLTPKLVDKLVRLFNKYPQFEYIDHMGETDSLFRSDLMVCDWSGAAVEYSLGLEKPVLFVDVPPRVRNPKFQELGIEPIEAIIRKQVGKIISMQELKKAPQMIAAILNDPELSRRHIQEIREQWVFNLGHSTEAAAKAIAKIAEEKASC